MPSIDFIKEIQENDRKTFFKDFENSKNYSQLDSDEESSNKSSNSRPLIADFTEYSPLHNGHFHCMKTAKGFHRVFSPSQWSFSLHENCKGKNS